MTPFRSPRRHAGAHLAVRMLVMTLALLPALQAARAEEPPAPGTPAPGAPTASAPASGAASPDYLADRGPGIATSLFGTYVRKGEWLVYAFYEYTKNSDFEYAPEDIGLVGNQEFFGSLREHEHLLFLSYGLSDRLAVELEGSLSTRSTLERPPADTSGGPLRLTESGLGDVEAQARWRWMGETTRRPELFSFFEVVFPLQKDKVLIGTQDWEYALGIGVIKGHRWGTLTGRLSVMYDRAEGSLESGEFAVEYLKRLSRVWRFVGALEGESDEVELILEAQARLHPHVLLKLNSGFGVTSKAADFAPEVGVLFSW
jgi:hypothetical protein